MLGDGGVDLLLLLLRGVDILNSSGFRGCVLFREGGLRDRSLGLGSGS